MEHDPYNTKLAVLENEVTHLKQDIAEMKLTYTEVKKENDSLKREVNSMKIDVTTGRKVFLGFIGAASVAGGLVASWRELKNMFTGS